jgi:hypothetical protein
MAQVCTVIQADPNSLKTALDTLAASNEIQIVLKTKSSGKFLVIYDDTATASQSVTVIVGDPDKLASEITTIASTDTIDLVSSTFSASQYVVVSR